MTKRRGAASTSAADRRLGEITDALVTSLREHPDNPRRISRDRLDQLKRSLEADPDFLRARPLIALRGVGYAADGTVVAGNQRLRAAVELGWESVPVVDATVDEQTARLWMLRDNNSFGEWDERPLAEMLAALEAGSVDVALAGFDSVTVDELLAGLGKVRDRPDPDEAPLPPAKPRSKAGEVYELGPHRLLCGDACDEAAVGALFATCGDPALMVTDPPYGVSLDHTWRDGLRQPIGAARSGKVANDDRFDWEAAYLLARAPIAYVWHSALYAGEVKAGLAAAGYEVQQQIIWVKTVHALGRAAYQWRHETCWYAVRKGTTARWKGGRSQTTVWEAASPIMAYGGGQDDQRTPHPTQKPVAVTAPPIANHTIRGDLIYDPFAGSGTTLIAADQLGRRALLVEIDPAYCDVIRDRWEAWNAD
jgi:DNA modification methylase